MNLCVWIDVNACHASLCDVLIVCVLPCVWAVCVSVWFVLCVCVCGVFCVVYDVFCVVFVCCV